MASQDNTAFPADGGPAAASPSLPGQTSDGRVSLRFMVAYALAQYTAWLGIMPPVILSIAFKISRIAQGAQKEYYLSTVLAVGAFGALVAAPIWGAISDRTRSRFGRRKVWMVVGCLLLLAGLVTIALATTLQALIIGWLICQMGSNANQAALNALMPDVVPEHQQGRMAALLGITMNLAIVTGVFMTQFTSENTLAMFLLPWLPGPFAIAFLLSSFKDKPAGAMPKFSLKLILSTFWVNPVRYPDFGWAFLSRFLIFLASSFFISYQLFFLTDHIGVPSDTVLEMIFYCTAVTTGLNLIFTPFSGWLSDKIGRRKPLVFFSALIVAGGLLSLTTAQSYTHFFISAAIYGIGVAIYYAVDIALCVAVLPDPENAAKDMGVIQIANSLPQSLAPAIAPLFLAIGTGGGNYPALFTAAAVIGLVGAVVVLPIRKSR